MKRWHGEIKGIIVFTEDGFLETNVRTFDVDWSLIEVNRKHENEFDIGVGPNRPACGWNG
jgi:hypothetical protein